GARRGDRAPAAPARAAGDGLVGADRPPPGALGRAARGSGGLDRAAPAFLAQAAVDHTHVLEDDLGRGLGLLTRRLGDLLEAHRLGELDGDLRELEPAPVAHALGARDRGRDDRRARLEREPPEPVARLVELAAPRAA